MACTARQRSGKGRRPRSRDRDPLARNAVMPRSPDLGRWICRDFFTLQRLGGAGGGLSPASGLGVTRGLSRMVRDTNAFSIYLALIHASRVPLSETRQRSTLDFFRNCSLLKGSSYSSKKKTYGEIQWLTSSFKLSAKCKLRKNIFITFKKHQLDVLQQLQTISGFMHEISVNLLTHTMHIWVTFSNAMSLTFLH